MNSALTKFQGVAEVLWSCRTHHNHLCDGSMSPTHQGVKLF